MTPEEAIEIIETTKGLYKPKSVQDAFDMAAQSLKEVQQYREIGTVEQVRNQKENLKIAYRIIGDYESVGTVEKCREAREKQEPKKCVIDSCPDHTHYKCPSCGKIQKTKYGNSTFGCISNNCSNCGQALMDENLEV